MKTTGGIAGILPCGVTTLCMSKHDIHFSYARTEYEACTLLR
jgi:hypothetical protein